MGDEGFGPHTIQLLQQKNLPDHVEALDGGTAATKMFSLLGGDVDKLVIIDTIQAGGKPGTVYRKHLGNISTLKPRWGVSQHQLGVEEAILIAKLEEKLPKDVVLIGVEPKTVSLGIGLSEEVVKAIPKVLEFVMEEVHKNC